ncbi:hypothetical protein ACOMHN_060418 [Nucella lapillus]
MESHGKGDTNKVSYSNGPEHGIRRRLLSDNFHLKQAFPNSSLGGGPRASGIRHNDHNLENNAPNFLPHFSTL